MTPFQKLVNALESHGHPVNRNGMCTCPCHNDKTASLHVQVGDNGGAVLNCFADCETEQIVSAIGLTMVDLMPNNDSGNSGEYHAHPLQNPARSFSTADAAIENLRERLGQPTSIYWYENSQQRRVGAVLRWDREEGKDFRPVSFREGQWYLEGIPKPRPLFKLPKLAHAESVVVTEGEKCVEAANSIGLIATCSAHGARSAKGTDWSPLAGKTILITPDNDDAGESFAEDVIELVEQLSPQPMVKIVRIPGLGIEEDIHDWLERHDAVEPEQLRENFLALADAEKPISFLAREAAHVSPQRARNELTPKRASELSVGPPVKWVWNGQLAKGLVTLFTSHPKVGKTTLVAHFLAATLRGGRVITEVQLSKVLVVTEESESLWMRRNEEREIGDNVQFICKPFNGKPRPKEWDDLISKAEEVLDNEGLDVLIIDTWAANCPVKDENSASETVEALGALNRLTSQGVAILLVHHLNKGDAAEGQGIRGTSALAGGVDIILEMRRYRPEDNTDRRRKITGYGRLEEIPDNLIIELTDSEYEVVGNIGDAKRGDRMHVLEDILSEGGMLTASDVKARWSSDSVVCPGIRTIEKDLRLGVENSLWLKIGDGKRNSPFRYGRLHDPEEEVAPRTPGSNGQEYEENLFLAENS